MKMRIIRKAEAIRRFKAGETVYIGAYSKAEGGVWWNPVQFAGSISPHGMEPARTTAFFRAASRYYTRYYARLAKTRTRYAVEVAA